MEPPKLGPSLRFRAPVKRIHDSQGTLNFQKSWAHVRLTKILDSLLCLVSYTECSKGLLSEQIVSIPGLDEQKTSLLPPAFSSEPIATLKDVEAVLELLNYIEALHKDTPPAPGPRRYGNLACRDLHRKLESTLESKLHEVFVESGLYQGEDSKEYIHEIQYYFLNAFGLKVRLDYGTGHELSFLAFIGALWMSGVLKDLDGPKVLAMFCRYYDVVRTLILAYTLEPAGSHGVWGLDDHFHLAYLLGAAQLTDAKDLLAPETSENLKDLSQQDSRRSSSYKAPPPLSVANKSIVDNYKTRNLYFNAVAFIYRVKQGPFWETLPILYDISGIKSWRKILVGLRKMYSAEVLSKFPVVQHFWFGGVFYPWVDSETNKALPEDQPIETGAQKKAFPGATTAAPWANNHKNLLNVRKPGLYDFGRPSRR